MQKLFTIISGCFLSVFILQAQPSAVKDTSYWKLSGVAGANMSQAALVNWVAGGDNTVSLNLYTNASLNYAKEKWSWTNDLILQYGQIYTKTDSWQKSSDKIAFTSKLGYQIKPKWYYSALLDYSTQFAKGYASSSANDYISRLMAPGYLNLALGIDYKPNDEWSAFYSPATLHAIYVLDSKLSDAGSYGVDKGKRAKYTVGSYLKVSFKKEVMENVSIISSLDAYTPYSSAFGNVDINWELLANFKINKLLTATLNTNLRYLDTEHYINSSGVDKGPQIQFKEIFGLGVAYKF